MSICDTFGCVGCLMLFKCRVYWVIETSRGGIHGWSLVHKCRKGKVLWLSLNLSAMVTVSENCGHLFHQIFFCISIPTLHHKISLYICIKECLKTGFISRTGCAYPFRSPGAIPDLFCVGSYCKWFSYLFAVSFFFIFHFCMLLYVYFILLSTLCM